MNLRTQLEGNSFAEMIERNTDGTHTLKADVFATADCKFELGHITSRSRDAVTPRVGDASGAGLGQRRPEHRLRREPAAAARSRTARSSTARATPSTRRASTARPSTTARPSSTASSAATTTTPSGATRATTSSRATAATTTSSAVTATTSSPTSTVPTSSRAVTATTRSTVARATTSSWAATAQRLHQRRRQRQRDVRRPGERLHQRSARARTPGSATAVTTGCRAAPARTCSRATTARRSSTTRREGHPGNDIFVGQPGENDYDAEGGDDIMAQNAADRPQRRRRRLRLGVPPVRHRPGATTTWRSTTSSPGLPLPVVVNRDRWQETEADSGSPFNDVIKGDDADAGHGRRGRVHRLRRPRPGGPRPDHRPRRRSSRASRRPA